MTPEWKEYTGSDEQIAEIKSANEGVMFEYVAGIGTDHSIFKYQNDRYHIDNRIANKAISKYLICDPHPYSDLINIWRLSGCPVYVRYTEPTEDGRNMRWRTIKTNTPDWNILGAECRLTPFSEEKLKGLLDSFGHHTEIIDIYSILLDECRELKEPWIPIDEFLKSGFEGQCWVNNTDNEVFECHFNEDDFMTPEGYVHFNEITHVMPIHKPEPQR